MDRQTTWSFREKIPKRRLCPAQPIRISLVGPSLEIEMDA